MPPRQLKSSYDEFMFINRPSFEELFSIIEEQIGPVILQMAQEAEEQLLAQEQQPFYQQQPLTRQPQPLAQQPQPLPPEPLAQQSQPLPPEPDNDLDDEYDIYSDTE